MGINYSLLNSFNWRKSFMVVPPTVLSGWHMDYVSVLNVGCQEQASDDLVSLVGLFDV